MSFAEILSTRYRKINSLLCVGLDPRYEDLNIPDEPSPGIITDLLLKFLQHIVDATHDVTLVYKANSAFFEQFGIEGYAALEKIRDIIPADIPFILDAKRGDISTTAEAYARAVFEKVRADAVTVNGYLGSDGVLPFAKYPEHGVFVLCRTSNPSAGELQNSTIVTNNWKNLNQTHQPLYIKQAQLAQEWNVNNNIGLVVGSTFPQELDYVRKTCPNMWILSPGVGAQCGDLESTVRAGYTDFGGIIINVGRGITGAENPQGAAQEYVQKILDVLSKIDN